MKSLVIKKNLSKILISFGIIVFFLFSGNIAFSQQELCLSKLKKAQELFDSGLIEEIPTMLDSCLKSGFNKQQAIQAYRLLIQVYLFDYNQEKAEQTMLSMLTQFPEYEIQSNDPVEFVNLYNLFQATPLYSFSVNTGLNITNVSLLEQFSTGNLNNLNSEYKSGGIKAGIRFSFEKYINTKSWITIGLGYKFSGFENQEKSNFERELLTFSEKMQWLNIPHYYNYSFKQYKRVTPYVFVGGQFAFLVKSEGELSNIGLGGNSSGLGGISKDMLPYRNRVNYSAILGVGIRYKIATGYLRFNAYYAKGLVSYVKDDSRYADGENLYYYNYIDDKIKLNSFNFTFGYSYIFYKISKKPILDNLN